MDDNRGTGKPVLRARRVGGSRHTETGKGRDYGRRVMPPDTSGRKVLHGSVRHGNGHRLVVPVRHGAGGPVPQVDCPDGGTFRERAYGHVPALSAWYVLLNGTDTA
ncbi:hypothetical protein [Bacteroides thetaiotaomicron]|uniref:hypothetical protein n=1 Tax=Bacteroides thetaiotaomicron TaxID=818 RepID=UPI0012D7F28A